MRLNNILKLIIAIVICEVVGIGGAFFTSPAASSSWYYSLEKPFLQPPSWIFSPVWIMLYALMGIAAFLVWQKGFERKDVRLALGVFGVQLFLNAIWSIIFFGLHSPGWALVDIIALWLAIVWTIVVFYKISKPAVYLLIPYILWVSFAAHLNYSIWLLN